MPLTQLRDSSGLSGKSFSRRSRPHKMHRASGANPRKKTGTSRKTRNFHSSAPRLPLQVFVAYLTSTVATPSNFFLMASASSLVAFSLRALGAPSTRSLASLRPSEVISRTALMVLILLAPASLRMTWNSVFSSTAEAAAPAPPRQPSPGPLRPPRRQAALQASSPEPPLPAGSTRQSALPTARYPPFSSPVQTVFDFSYPGRKPIRKFPMRQTCALSIAPCGQA